MQVIDCAERIRELERENAILLEREHDVLMRSAARCSAAGEPPSAKAELYAHHQRDGAGAKDFSSIIERL